LRYRVGEPGVILSEAKDLLLSLRSFRFDQNEIVRFRNIAQIDHRARWERYPLPLPVNISTIATATANEIPLLLTNSDGPQSLLQRTE